MSGVYRCAPASRPLPATHRRHGSACVVVTLRNVDTGARGQTDGPPTRSIRRLRRHYRPAGGGGQLATRPRPPRPIQTLFSSSTPGLMIRPARIRTPRSTPPRHHRQRGMRRGIADVESRVRKDPDILDALRTRPSRRAGTVGVTVPCRLRYVCIEEPITFGHDIVCDGWPVDEVIEASRWRPHTSPRSMCNAISAHATLSAQNWSPSRPRVRALACYRLGDREVTCTQTPRMVCRPKIWHSRH